MKAARLLLIGAAVTIGAITSTAAWAQDKEKIIAERQDLMKKQIREWIVVRNYVQGSADQQAALAAVDALEKLLPTVPKYFPPGTAGPAPDGKWGTKPEVWTENDKFLAAVKKVSEQVAALDTAVKSGDKAKVEVAFKELDACNACHNTFRAKLQ
jgi:cytochrome c556